MSDHKSSAIVQPSLLTTSLLRGSNKRARAGARFTRLFLAAIVGRWRQQPLVVRVHNATRPHRRPLWSGRLDPAEVLESRAMLAGTPTLTVLPESSAMALAQALVGDGVVVSNPKLTAGEKSAGFFSNGISTGIGLSEGIILSSGRITNAIGPNTSDSKSAILDTPGTAVLDALVPGSRTYDATVLEFEFETAKDSLSFQYVFASEEYNEFSGSIFNDVFGFFVDGVNVALIPGTTTPVSINNVNAAHNKAFFRNNDPSDLGTPTPFQTQADGFTSVLKASVNLQPGKHHIRLAIADVADDIYDSWVFLPSRSFVSGTGDLRMTVAAEPTMLGSVPGVALVYTVTNVGLSTVTGATFQSVLPSALELVGASASRGMASGAGGAVVAALGTLAPGDTAQISVMAKIIGSGPITAAASVDADQADSQPADNFTMITLPPTVSISTSRTLLRPQETATITFSLSAPSVTFGQDDVVVTGGTLSQFAPVDGSQRIYRATFTPNPSFTGSGGVRVLAGSFFDLEGNTNEAETALSPVMDVRTNDSWISAAHNGVPIDTLKAGQTAVISFLFKEPVSGFTAGDVTVTGGTLSAFSGSGQSYTAIFTPRSNSTAPGTVRIASDRYTNSEGVPNLPLQMTPSITINTVVPTLTINQRLPLLKGGQSTLVTFQVRGTVNTAGPNASPFELSDISLAPNQGSLSNLTSLGVNRGVHTYTAIYTAPAASFSGPVTLTVPANSFKVVGNDANGNAAASLTINVDAQGPGTVLSTTAQALKIGQTAIIDFTIANETANVVGFEAGDITIASGTISAPARVPGTNRYRATFTPASDFEGQVTIGLPAGRFTDAAGNPNTAATAITLSVDTKAPVAPLVSLVSDTGVSPTDSVTSDARLQTTGTEAGASVQYWTSPALTTAWTPTLASQGPNTVYVTQTDTAGNRSTATAFAFEYRSAGPAPSAIQLPAASTGLIAGRFVELRVTFARPVFVTVNTVNRPFIVLAGFTTGEATRRAFYASGSGTATLVFRYQVQAGDKALTGITYPSSTIALDGATIRDAAGNAASLAFTLPSRRPVTRIDAQPPVPGTTTLVASGNTGDVVTLFGPEGVTLVAYAGLQFTYTPVSDGSPLPMRMNILVGGSDFATNQVASLAGFTRYLGQPFVVVWQGVTYNGTWTDGTVIF